MTSAPRVTEQTLAPHGIAAVHARLPGARVPAMFKSYLDQVYAAARAGTIAVDGQNVFLYRPAAGGEVDVDFGVGVAAPFAAAGAVRFVELPAGRAATATHWGDYARLGETHAAVVEWCRAQGRALAGPRWEVYGHAKPDETPRTDVYYLLADQAAAPPA